MAVKVLIKPSCKLLCPWNPTAQVVFAFTFAVISLTSEGVIPPNESTIQNRSATPLISDRLSRNPLYSVLHFDIYIVLNATSNPIAFTAFAKTTARSKFFGSTARRIMSANPLIGVRSSSRSSGNVLFSFSITASFLLELLRSFFNIETGV